MLHPQFLEEALSRSPGFLLQNRNPREGLHNFPSCSGTQVYLNSHLTRALVTGAGWRRWLCLTSCPLPTVTLQIPAAVICPSLPAAGMASPEPRLRVRSIHLCFCGFFIYYKSLVHMFFLISLMLLRVTGMKHLKAVWFIGSV